MITQATFTKHLSNALRTSPAKAGFNCHLLRSRHKLNAIPVCEGVGSCTIKVKHGDIEVYLSELIELEKHNYTANPLVSVSYRG